MSIGNLKIRRHIATSHFNMWVDCGAKKADLNTFVSRTEKEGLSFLTKTLPLLGKALESGLETGHFVCPTNFRRRHRQGGLPALLGFLFARVFKADGTLKDVPCPYAIRDIRQCVYYTYKADIPYESKVTDKVLDDFVRVDESLSHLSFEKDDTLTLASRILFAIFGGYSRDAITPRHGPGVTADVDIHQKYEFKLTAGLPVNDFGLLHFFNEKDGVDRLNRYPVFNHETLFRSYPTAKVILVPKDSRGPRLISCEPASNQYIQQGIMSYMVGKLESYPLTSGQVNFTDQTVNQRLAEESSKSRAYSTLDLKEASDRVSLRLFDFLFDSCDQLKRDILLCRSTHTLLPNGRKLRLNKFAPMGSALCFPVMSASIFAILLAELTLTTGDQNVFKKIFVYGDDIIVPSEYTDIAIAALQRYGLLVNREKSFTHGFFRESCGGDFYNGVNVTPVRLRKCVLTGLKEPERSAYDVYHSNELDSFPRNQAYFRDRVRKTLGPIPFGDDFCGVLHYTNRFRVDSHQRNRSVRYLWRVKTCTDDQQTSAWGHLHRVFPGIGSESSKSSIFGRFDLPKKWKLIRTKV